MAGWDFQRNRRAIMGEAERLIDALLAEYPDSVTMRHSLTVLCRVVGDLAGEIGYNSALSEVASERVPAAVEPSPIAPWTTLNVGMVG